MCLDLVLLVNLVYLWPRQLRKAVAYNEVVRYEWIQALISLKETRSETLNSVCDKRYINRGLHRAPGSVLTLLLFSLTIIFARHQQPWTNSDTETKQEETNAGPNHNGLVVETFTVGKTIHQYSSSTEHNTQLFFIITQSVVKCTALIDTTTRQRNAEVNSTVHFVGYTQTRPTHITQWITWFALC